MKGTTEIETQDNAAFFPIDGASPDIGLRLIAESPWIILLLAPSGHVLYVNRAGAVFFEADATLVGRDVRSLCPASEVDLLSKAIEGAQAGRAGQITLFSPTTRGVPRWLEVGVTPIQGALCAHAGCIMLTLRDITQSVAIHESLKNSQQRFRALADNMAQHAWMADETGHAFWFNKRWLDYTGTTMGDMEGWGWKKVHHPDHLDRVTRKWKAHLQTGEVWEDLFPLKGADGAYRWFLSRAIPFRDATGRIELWCGTNTDITEQRNATQRLRQKARLIELSHEAIFSRELDGAILTWNRGCEELYGYKSAEAIGRFAHDLLKSQHAIPLDDVKDILVTDGAWSGEALHIAKDGTKVWVESRQELLLVDGKSTVLETNRDITDRRRADEVRNLLMAELNHRVKNTLAIVQSIASQTARSSTDMKEYAESFRGRLQALATAHNLLTDAHWYGASLDNLVTSEFQATFGEGANVSVEGERIFLTPQTALHFSLILHELATNALKHGAISVPGGSVAVSWRRTGADRSSLEFVWRERGGPSVVEPPRRGFGTTLIGRSGKLPQISTSLTFAPQGVECVVTADLKDERISGADIFNPARSEAPLSMSPRVRRLKNAQAAVLVIETEPLQALELEAALHDAGFGSVGPALTVQSALEAISRADADVIALDCANMSAQNLELICDRIASVAIPYCLIAESGALPESCVGVPYVYKPVRTGALVEALLQALPNAPRVLPGAPPGSTS